MGMGSLEQGSGASEKAWPWLKWRLFNCVVRTLLHAWYLGRAWIASGPKDL